MSRSQNGSGQVRSMLQVILAGAGLGAFLAGCATGGKADGARFEAAYADHSPLPTGVAFKYDDDAIHPQSLADYHFTLGEALSLEGQTSESIEEFRTVLVHDPKSVPVRVRLATEYVKVNRMEQALTLLDEVKKMDPNNSEARLLLGGIYGSMKNYDQAIAEYEAVIKQDPTNFEAYLYLGAVHAERKNYDKALAAFDKLIPLEDSPLHHLSWFYKGRVYLDQETPAAQKKAIEAFKKTLQLKPDYTEALFALSQVYVKENQPKLAIETLARFQKERGPSMRVAETLAQLYLEAEDYVGALEQLRFVEKNPDEMLNAKVRISLILIEQKQYAEAAVKLSEVLQFVPDSDKVRFYLAAVNEEMDKKEEAITHFQKVPSTSPYFGEAMVHGAYMLRQLKRAEEALAMANQGIAARPDLPQLYAIKASLLDDKAQYNEALVVLKEATEKFPDHVQLKFYLGTVEDHAGNKAAVVDSMNKVLALDANHVQAMNYLAYTYADMNSNLEEAERLAKAALDLEPKDGFIMDTYGWILFKRGKSKEALRYLETAHQHQPKESIIAEHLGDVYLQLSMLDKARKMYEKAAASAESDPRQKMLNEKISALDNQVVPADSRQPASTR